MNIKWSKHLYFYIGFYEDRCLNFDVSHDTNRNILHVSYTQYISNGNGGRTGNYEYDKLSIDTTTGSVLESEKTILTKLPSSLTVISPDSKHYYFENYDIFMESDWVVCCQDKDTHSTIWKKNVRHWLWTEIECRDGILYFGTQGNGGKFYALSLANGDEIFSMKNASPKFYWIRDNLLIDNEKGVWDLVDRKTGTVIESTLKAQIQFQIDNDIVFTQNSYNRSTKQYDATLIYAEL